MAKPTCNLTAPGFAVGPITVTVPQNYVLSILFKIHHTDPAGDIYHYWVSVADSASIQVDYDGARVLRVDVPAGLVQAVSTPFLQWVLMDDPSLPPGPPILRP